MRPLHYSNRSRRWSGCRCASCSTPVLRRYSAALRRWCKATALAPPFFLNRKPNWQRNTESEEVEGIAILRHLVATVTRLQEGITEQEYVVTNGRIEAALSEQSGAPLMRVSHEMGLAVAKVRDAIWRYRSELEEVLHESSAGF